jgi:cytochrome c oxidase subunit IV
MAETAVAIHAPAAGEMARKRPYIPVFVTLAVVTGIELAITQQGLLPEIEHTLRIVVLVILSTIKASLVIAYYMHLRYEPRWLALIPLAGLALVAVLVAALTATVAHP